jgi:hypothetical protein
MECIKGISVEEVLQSALEIMNPKQTKESPLITITPLASSEFGQESNIQ